MVPVRIGKPLRREVRDLETVTDLGVAFSTAIDEITGALDSSIPAVYSAIRIITDLVASLPMQQVIGGAVTPDTPPLLTEPNPPEPYQSTLSKVVASLLFKGNAYLRPRTRDGRGNVTSLLVLNPDEVTCRWDRSALYPEYEWRGRILNTDELVHIPLNLWPGRPDGVGPVTAARLVLAGAKAEVNMARRLAEDSSPPGGVLQVPGTLDATEAQRLQTLWEDAHLGRARLGVLGNGIEWKQIAFNPVDAQFLESRNFTVQEIARMFGLPGHFLLVDSGSSLTYSTVEGLMQAFLTTTLSPTYLERIEAGFTRLLPRGASARFNVEGLLRADQAARYEAYKVGLESQFLTIDDVRRAEHLPAIGGASG